MSDSLNEIRNVKYKPEIIPPEFHISCEEENTPEDMHANVTLNDLYSKQF